MDAAVGATTSFVIIIILDFIKNKEHELEGEGEHALASNAYVEVGELIHFNPHFIMPQLTSALLVYL